MTSASVPATFFIYAVPLHGIYNPPHTKSLNSFSHSSNILIAPQAHAVFFSLQIATSAAAPPEQLCTLHLGHSGAQ